MRYFRQLKLGRGWGNLRRRPVDNDPKDHGGNGVPAKQPDTNEHAADAQHGERNERRHGTSAEIAIAFFTGALLVVAWRQNGIQDRQANISQNQLALGERQFGFTTNEAAANANVASASLNVSESAARATEAQATAMKQMAGAAAKQAEAAESQARSAAELVNAQQAGQIDIKGRLTNPQSFKAEFTITNTGSATVRDAEIFTGVIVIDTGHSDAVWNFMRLRQTVTLALTGSITLQAQPEEEGFDFGFVSVGEEEIVIAALVKFHNPGQRRPEERKLCYTFSGALLDRGPCRDKQRK